VTRWMTRVSGVVALTVLILAVFIQPTQAQLKAIRVFVNGAALRFDVAPTVVGGRTLVPLRAIFEALGAEVTWNQETQSATASWDGGTLELPVGKAVARLGGQERSLDVPAQLIGGRTMVPLRFIGEALGAQVGWYGQSSVITINKALKALLPATVTRVVDGDTVEVALVDGTTEKVRMIGVDTPETVHPEKGTEAGGPEASAFTKERLTGQTVNLELDVEERDHYGRLLAYVYLPNGTMFNATLADEGHARMATFPPNVRYVEVFRALQGDAEAAGRGLWPEVPTKPSYIPAYSVPEGTSTSENGLRTLCSDFDPDPEKHCNKPDPNQPPLVIPPPEPYTGPLPFNPSGADRDCTEFKPYGWRIAQAFYEAAGGPISDRHRLDDDDDGIACEDLQ